MLAGQVDPCRPSMGFLPQCPVRMPEMFPFAARRDWYPLCVDGLMPVGTAPGVLHMLVCP